ncbi:unnamed protein product [Protopolystoma xenopodis]|uniref:Uncharacterized protein n=1 Tax=Protopolystoma xenopodis TaxID=117903 RepID=A0A3S5FD42_9PLAT|nr:unnamed protein product [Protopolystoma xenopodis]
MRHTTCPIHRIDGGGNRCRAVEASTWQYRLGIISKWKIGKRLRQEGSWAASVARSCTRFEVKLPLRHVRIDRLVETCRLAPISCASGSCDHFLLLLGPKRDRVETMATASVFSLNAEEAMTQTLFQTSLASSGYCCKDGLVFWPKWTSEQKQIG